MNGQRLDPEPIDQLFLKARTYNGWRDPATTQIALEELYALARLGPTAGNCSPARFVFVTSPEGKQRLSSHVSRGNREKTMAAPVCAIVAYDLDFANTIPFLFPHNPGAASWYADPDVRKETALRNSSLQGAYLIMAARTLGYDCGPMSGFDNAGVDREFFADTSVRSNFLINIGHGDPATIKDRLPRLPFSEACRVV